MVKYKKEEIHRIDMSERCKIKIVHEELSVTDEEEWENEMIRINERMKKSMQRYEENLRALIISALSDTQKDETRDDNYFIREYGDKFIGRNPENIKNRIDIYNKYIETKNN